MKAFLIALMTTFVLSVGFNNLSLADHHGDDHGHKKSAKMAKHKKGKHKKMAHKDEDHKCEKGEDHDCDHHDDEHESH